MRRRLAVVAPGRTLSMPAAEAAADAAMALDLHLNFHPQCFLSSGHFAGTDAERLDAFVSVMNDPAVDAVWLARGGYGSNRIAAEAVRSLRPEALAKPVMGYSDGGFLLAALHRRGGRAVHGPMVQDGLRDGGGSAVGRALKWLAHEAEESVEPTLFGPTLAFNLTVLSNLMGTALEPDFGDVTLMVEDVSEEEYRTDRTMFHLSSQPALRRVRAIRAGRFSDVRPNDCDFGVRPPRIVAEWCARQGLAFDPTPADIGHDSRNRVVPFPWSGAGLR